LQEHGTLVTKEIYGGMFKDSEDAMVKILKFAQTHISFQRIIRDFVMKEN